MTVSEAIDYATVAERVLGHNHWDVPREIIRAVFRPNSRVAVKACHASSKTFTAADCVLLALLLRGDVLTTAPTWEQVRDVLWQQVRSALIDSAVLADYPIDPKDWGEITQTSIRMPDGSRAIGLSTNEAVRFQGHHARPGSFLLVILDEAPGVRPDIYEAVEGISAGGDVRILLLGNPVVASGPFYEVFRSGGETWARYTIDAFDTPNLRGLTLRDLLEFGPPDLDVSSRPYLVTRRWVLERYHEWGESHPLWQSRVRGEFPEQSEDALYSLKWLERAERPATTGLAADVGPAGDMHHHPGRGRGAGGVDSQRLAASGPAFSAGLDVAGPGEDETVLTVRQGGDVCLQRGWGVSDPRGDILSALAPYRHNLDRLNVDSAGLGWGMYTHLREEIGQDIVRPVNVGAAPTNKLRTDGILFHDLKAEVYFNLRDWLKEGMVSGLSARASAQLAGVQYFPTPQGKMRIVPKDKLRDPRTGALVNRSGDSPDWAESTVLAFWGDPRVAKAQTYGGYMKIRRRAVRR